MSRVEIIEEEFVIEDLESELEQERDAAQDLKRVEDAAKKEAETSAAKADKLGDERASAEAAGTAFDFDQAAKATEAAEDRVESRSEEGGEGWVEVVERTGNADLAAKADKREAVSDQHQGNLLDVMKESLGSAADAVKTAATNAKDTAREAADNMRLKK